MLLELRVQNLLLIESAELSLDPGLNVITGETGAGKTVLAQALDMLLGGKPARGLLRPGAEEAYVEGVFAGADSLAADSDLADLHERVGLDGQEVVLARRITADGRSRAYVHGRSASAPDLRAIGTRLLSFYGQHEHRRLTLASAQLEVLDSFCGRRHLQARAEYERLWTSARRLEQELEQLRDRVGARERDLDLLEFELHEIEQAAPDEAEEERLEAERSRLASVETLRQSVLGATAALEPGGEGDVTEGVLSLLSRASAELASSRGVDAALDRLADRAAAMAYEAEDIARELRDYESSLQADPGRLEQLDERLAAFGRLKRKHGGSIAEVLAHAERCREEHARLSNAEETTARLESELDTALAELDRAAAKLSAERRKVASKLEREVRGELASLAMAEASFEVVVGEREHVEGAGALERLGPKGADSVEMVIAPNPGVAAGRLREIASGGELSRVMLALMSIATGAGGASTVVFDEVDAGVGGNTARAVGERLRTLARHRQVICITHLPQVASLAARHFRVVKRASADAGVARTDVERLDHSGLVAELCRMLGADSADGTVRRHAERLLEAA